MFDLYCVYAKAKIILYFLLERIGLDALLYEILNLYVIIMFYLKNSCMHFEIISYICLYILFIILELKLVLSDITFYYGMGRRVYQKPLITRLIQAVPGEKTFGIYRYVNCYQNWPNIDLQM